MTWQDRGRIRRWKEGAEEFFYFFRRTAFSSSGKESRPSLAHPLSPAFDHILGQRSGKVILLFSSSMSKQGVFCAAGEIPQPNIDNDVGRMIGASLRVICQTVKINLPKKGQVKTGLTHKRRGRGERKKTIFIF